MISFADLVRDFQTGGENGLSFDAPESWAQGRTLYGGLSAALCHVSARETLEIDKPIKSAVVAFVGPSSGHLTGEAALMRQGKSTIMMDATLHGERGIGTKTLLVYGDDRDSKLDQSGLVCSNAPPPEDCEPFWGERKPANFARNFEIRRAGGLKPMGGEERGDMLVWVRHATETGADHTAALLALADVIPPACFTMMEEGAPVSTVTWSLEFLRSDIEVGNEWFLLSSVAEHTAHGYSSQAMYMWDRQGRPVIASRQSVTVFF
ncbi:thioesterase family protein [Ponticaulis koreensis]|uniref:thioesterase family protein n=1 Tax=Ponticaulis koreensis TaxID=1123045 RepID=UPI0003B3CF82|nr:thioesterase family protein [Ponticaulis koreensis]